MKRLLTLVFISVSLSVGATLLATWASMMVRTAHRHQSEAATETPNG